MANNNALPIDIGVSDTNANLAQLLGEVFVKGTLGSPGYRAFLMVKNASGGTLSKNQVLVRTTDTSGSPGWGVTTTTTANDQDVIGVVPSDFGSNTIAANAYFLLQVGGYCTPNFANTSLTRTTNAGGALATATTVGYCQSYTAATDAATVLATAIGKATNTAGVTAAGAPGTALLFGLIR